MPYPIGSKEVDGLTLYKTLIAVALVGLLCGHVESAATGTGPDGATGTDSLANQPSTLTDGLESGTFSTLGWETCGDRPWFMAADNAHEGLFSARSGDIGPGQTSELVLDLKFNTDGEFSFWLTVDSSEVGGRLTFFIDGEEQAQWSGRIDWVCYKKGLPRGLHRFSWIYSIDSSTEIGRAAAWIDDVTFPWTEDIDPFRLSPAAGSMFWLESADAPWTRSR